VERRRTVAEGQRHRGERDEQEGVRRNLMIEVDAGMQGVLTFAYLGEARQEKGFGLLFEALRIVYSRGHDVRFTIHVPHLTKVQAAEIPSFDGRLQWITGALLPQAYYRLLSSASAVLVPYDNREYTYRTSHIFVEALGLGKPVVTMRGTWMDAEMARMSALPGCIAEEFSAQSLGDAICQLVESWPTAKSALPSSFQSPVAIE
jgi:glycosyltransferase involved in cell wall biosynthesis